jgi:hypothetical protein
MRPSAKVEYCELHHISAHFAFAPTAFIVSIALYISFCFFLLLIYVSMSGNRTILDVLKHRRSKVEHHRKKRALIDLTLVMNVVSNNHIADGKDTKDYRMVV